MKENIVEKATELIVPIVENLGYEVVEITYGKNYGENNLTVFIYKKGGVSLCDCEKVNDALNDVLEENDVTEGQAYNFNVSSPGLDRPIKSDDDYRRSLDTEIEILFKKPLGKKKKANGILIGYDENSVTLSVKGKETVFDKENFEVVRPYIKF
ncbi:MAG: ribosome maturation factor RimP [Christensenellales bacterium]